MLYFCLAILGMIGTGLAVGEYYLAIKWTLMLYGVEGLIIFLIAVVVVDFMVFLHLKRFVSDRADQVIRIIAMIYAPPIVILIAYLYSKGRGSRHY